MSYMVYDAMEPVVIMERKRIADGAGGFITTWADGAEFEAAISFDSSMQARRAETEGVTSLYTVIVHENTELDFHDVFKRVSDGHIFRITSNTDDKKTPKMASFKVREYTAEEWTLPV